jgi:hypothetical protein
MRQFTLAEFFSIAEALPPATDAAGRTGTYVNVGKSAKLFLVYHITQGNAATIALTPQQGQGAAGANPKAISATAIWTNEDEVTSDLLTKQANAASYTTGAATKHKVVIFEISPQDCMDVANGYNFIAAQTGSSNAANITAAMFYAQTNFPQAQPPSILS